MGWEEDLIKTLEDEIKKDSTENLYNGDFYKAHEKYKPIYNFLGDLIYVNFQPKSVIDFGCGCGFLLQKLKEHGVPKLLGLEGSEEAQTSWNDNMKDILKVQDIIKYKPTERYDLSICMEVAEHIPSNKAEKLIKNITSSSNVVWWTAAVPGQGGTGHINCQSICYWTRLFEDHGFIPMWEATYEFKQSMLKMHEICLAYPWFRDNLLILKRVR